MRITWLLERADELWGGVKVALEDANWLAARGHHVTVLSRSAPPSWMALRCAFQRVADFRPEHLPDADLTIGTFWSTVPWAASARRGVPVHYCQGYEGDNPENAPVRERIEAVYRLPGVRHLTISPHLTALLRRRFGVEAREIVYAIDHEVHRPGPVRAPGATLRVGIVGPFQVPWKDVATGIAACKLAAAAGQRLELVRVTNTEPDPRERDLPFAVEWHQRVPPSQMGEIYRSLDVFLGTSSGDEEGFFLPAVEAMACGVPAVLTDVPCFRAHGDGSYALFVPPKDPSAMAEALVVAGRLPEVRAALRAHGLQAAARYTPQAHGRELEQALLSFALAGRAGERATLRASPREPLIAPAAPSSAPASAPRQPVVLPAAGAGPARPRGAAAVPATPRGEAIVIELRQQLLEAAQRLRHEHDPARAADLFAAAARLGAPGAALESAWCRHLGGDSRAALRDLEELLRQGHDEPLLHERRGILLHGLGAAADAVQAFRAAIAAGGRSADAYNNLGVVLFEVGDLSGARTSFERALVLEPQHEDAQANLAAIAAA